MNSNNNSNEYQKRKKKKIKEEIKFEDFEKSSQKIISCLNLAIAKMKNLYKKNSLKSEKERIIKYKEKELELPKMREMEKIFFPNSINNEFSPLFPFTDNNNLNDIMNSISFNENFSKKLIEEDNNNN